MENLQALSIGCVQRQAGGPNQNSVVGWHRLVPLREAAAGPRPRQQRGHGHIEQRTNRGGDVTFIGLVATAIFRTMRIPRPPQKSTTFIWVTLAKVSMILPMKRAQRSCVTNINNTSK